MPLLLEANSLGAGTPARPDAPDGCAKTGVEAIVVAAVEPRLELRLADGQRLRLVGLDPALPTPSDPDLADSARSAMNGLLQNRTVSVRLLAARPDRWGRLPALAFEATDAVAPDARDSIATTAIAHGWARYLAEPPAHACREETLRAEQNARQAGLGLWHDPYYAVLRVDDQAAFLERSGTTVVAEGQLSEVQPGRFRTKLRFKAPDGSPRGRTLVATVLPRVMKVFQAQGIDFSALIGHTLRIRGLLDLRFGPQIELTGPDALEITAGRPSASSG